MLKPAAVFAIGIAFLLGNAVSAGAISIISQSNLPIIGDPNESCSSGTLGVCNPLGLSFPVVPLHPEWQGNNPGGSGAVWVSYNPLTGATGLIVNLLPDSVLTPGATFSEILPSGPGTLTLSVWADDTARVSVTGTGGGVLTPAAGTAPNFPQDICADGKLGCEPGEQGDFTVLLGPGAHTLNIEVFQVGGDAFGTMWSGTFTASDELAPVPEPASILLLGSALAAVGAASRRRWLKK